MFRTLVLTGVALLIALSPHPVGAGDVTVDGKFVSTVPTGTPPLQVDSSTLVPNLNADLLGGLPASAFSPEVGNLIRVAKTGGHFSSIQAALDSITDAGIDKWYVVLVGPGVYNESVALKNFVSVIGYGILATRIVAEGTGDVTGVSGALAVISDLSVVARSTDGGNATGLLNPFLVYRSSITAETSAPGQALGVRVSSSGNASLFDCEIAAEDGTVNMGLFMETPAGVLLSGGSIRARSTGNSSATNYGVRRAFVSGTGLLELDGVFVQAAFGTTGWGIRSEDGRLIIQRSRISGSGSGQATGIYVAADTIAIDESSVSASGSASTRVGLDVVSATVRLRHSSAGGATAVKVDGSSILKAAYSQISGSLSGAGTFECIGLYDQNYTSLSCPP